MLMLTVTLSYKQTDSHTQTIPLVITTLYTMRSSASVVSAVFSLALLASQAVATPPACLLACVAQVTKASSTCSSLNQVGCVCSKEADQVKQCLDSICPSGDADAAYSAFQSSCSEQGASLGGSSAHSSKAVSSATSTSASSSSSETAATTTSTSSSKAASSSSETAATTSTSSSAPSSSAAASTTVSVSSAKPTTALTKSSTQASSTISVSQIHSGAGNLLQSGNSFAIAAIAALLI
ncbi:Ccw14p KNAG_0B06100 [Huiozyma naganishii CBS 8797]|uniref:CFEM domain-containing protein n=1 Tax=Huiozyma naganishii (strain ATCC MYA-139 / BCRC 22969 / CBS 8797 / KCTC 17520 / NBRC 10181 / NCYC 3082 / Yp74L-3) TaxID=1071383 RepID=J7R2K3_HUIN7|nr:hypothetical protein KNAG_0B06100 [Kazachstania naganishii CBS 8797]CCK69040.1 hypothetical protein KNAG_0B06100 [Kazachstania naganishii CBS 8797]